ncbi:MAG: EamA family transporter [Pseudomonadota bacterium]|nr:EamA family transporter [Pseudomonadota bacterium]
MELLWIPISVTAALMQAIRTAAQKNFNQRHSTMVTTYVRSLFGLPPMIVYLWAVSVMTGDAQPRLNSLFLFHSLGAAVSQMAATYLLIRLFTLRNFAIGTTLTKTDVMITALIGSVFFAESIDGFGWIAILLTVAGVILISIARTGVDALTAGRSGLVAALLSKPTQIGLATGAGFALSYLFLRQASLSLGDHGFLIRAGWTVVTVTTLQVVLLGIWLVMREPKGLRAMFPDWRMCSFIGLTSALGSICWFTAMTIQNASYVKAVGQVETIFTLAISCLYFKEKFNAAELLGIAVIVAGVLLFLL